MSDAPHDTSVPQLLARLVVETEKLIRLTNDITKHGTTAQSKSSLTMIGTEVTGILGVFKKSIEPLYTLYEIDPGMKQAAKPQDPEVKKEEYDESALWGDVSNKG